LPPASVSTLGGKRIPYFAYRLRSIVSEISKAAASGGEAYGYVVTVRHKPLGRITSPLNLQPSHGDVSVQV
jgi:hypothetical protein